MTAVAMDYVQAWHRTCTKSDGVERPSETTSKVHIMVVQTTTL
jgi:hypothetical protein